MIPFTNGRLIIRRPTQILDHGTWIPDFENFEEVPAGRYSIQPALGGEDHDRSIAVEAEWVAYGDATPIIHADDEVNISFDTGETITGLQVIGPARAWNITGVGLKHHVVQLKRRGGDPA